MAQDQSHDPHEDRESTQALAKIQHSEAHEADRVGEEDDKAPLVADPRNRLAEGKVDPATKELKPKDA